MAQNTNPVFRDLNVGFQRGGKIVETALKGGQCALGPEIATAAMCLRIKAITSQQSVFIEQTTPCALITLDEFTQKIRAITDDPP